MSKRVKPGSPTVAVAYIRASTDDQRLTLEAQRAGVEAWAAGEGVQVAAWFVDAGVSGSAPVEGRAGLLGALGALREHGAGILVALKRDRFARDAYVAMAIERAASSVGAQIHAADGMGNGGDPGDELLRRILDAVAAHELAMIRARTKAALAVKRTRGEVAGTVPYGQRLAADGVHLEAHPAEAAVVDEARALRAEGLSLRDVVLVLETAGHRSRAGKPFGLTQVHRMVG